MLLQEFQNKFDNEIVKGQFVNAVWCSEKKVKGVVCRKVSYGVIRFVKYGNIKGVKVVGKVNVNEQCVIPNTLYYNTNTKNYYVQLATTNALVQKQEFFINGVECDKETYQTLVKPSDHSQSPVFRVKLENLLSLGN